MLPRNINNTLTAICRYYMEFLESDFKKNRLPSRRLNIPETNGMLKTIDMSTYKSFNKKCLKKLSDGFDNADEVIHKQKYVSAIMPSSIKAIVSAIEELKGEKKQNSFESIQKLLMEKTDLRIDQVVPIVNGIINNIDNAEQYLRALKAYDLYEDLFELWKNKQLLEKEEIYLYMYDITFQGQTYPLFYLQVNVELKEDKAFSIAFNPVLMINKKAIQYVSENYAKLINKTWRIDAPSRQIYFGNYSNKSDYLRDLSRVVDEITNFFTLQHINFSEVAETLRENEHIAISNNCYFVLFDKSDEAILNDYEELLNMLIAGDDSQTLQILDKLGQDYLFGNPESFSEKVEREYEDQEVGDKLVFQSPIPLNKEQIQVISAINKTGCERIIIQGPPGTGKSHTITAIIYDALLNNKTVLVTSDKREALDVVEEKIEQVLDKMKIDDYLQNPILRLGKKDNNFNKIFNQSNYDKIKGRYHAYIKEKVRIEQDIEKISNTIKTEITESIDFQGMLSQEITEWLLEYEPVYEYKWGISIDIKELQEGALSQFKQLVNQIKIINEIAGDPTYTEKLNITKYKSSNSDLIRELEKCRSLIQTIQEIDNNNGHNYFFWKDIDDNNFDLLEEVIVKANEAKLPILGHLLSSKKVEDLENVLKRAFPNTKDLSLRKHQRVIENELSLYRVIRKIGKEMDAIKFNGFLVFQEKSYDLVKNHIEMLISEVKKINTIKELKNIWQGINYSSQKAVSIFTNLLATASEEEVFDLLKYLTLKSQIVEFTLDKTDKFLDQRAELEKRLILKMTNILDESVINLRENHRNAVEDLKKMIKQKRKISTAYLEKLIKAFPCLIVNIRELGDYIPLEANLFDLIIIDEASQVSIAQAFPAIMRGKKIVVLGDDKQFSNVKSHNASISINNYFLNELRTAFRDDLSNSNGEYNDYLVEEKINNFNIKNSILNFMKSVVNYECVLKKHFRGYMEIIGYSNDTFYKSLEIMKISGKSISDVIRFCKVEIVNTNELYKNTNTAEAEFIANELDGLDKNGFQGSIGIITPFTNQQKLISNMVYNSGQWVHYANKFRLKIMTFDSCQGDEKDIIYYSMVEKDNEDILKYIFPVSFDAINLEEEGNLKAQRLNVGFSRAKESIVLVTSKDIENIRGEVGNALRKYQAYLKQPDYMHAINKTDPNSPAEAKILNYIYQTELYKSNSDCIEIIPQFGIGKYIKQIDPYAVIPDYRVDFLLIYKTNDGKEKLIIIEYDGFEYHFDQDMHPSIIYSDKDLISSDIERQKTIELYGYPFVRLNKFNLTEEPIHEINRRLNMIIFKKKIENKALGIVRNSYKMLAKNEGKICNTCKEIKPLNSFRDDSLPSSFGRVCVKCKEASEQEKNKEKTEKKCKECGIVKPLDEFYDAQLISGHRRTCNTCREMASQKSQNAEITDKKCKQCGRIKPLDHFKRKRAQSGYGNICSGCISKCPRCGYALTKLYNSFGSYYGCSNPRCTFERSYID